MSAGRSARTGGATGSGIDEAVRVLCAGGLVAFPTETVYGLGADASSPEAIASCFAAKGRPADHPVIVHVAERTALDEWSSEPPASARRLVEAFWPGPLTVVVPRADHVLDDVTGGQETVALRMPDQPVASALLRGFAAVRGRPSGIVAPSANRFGQVSPTTADAVTEDLGDAVDIVLDDGLCAVGVESTIVDCTADPPRILRPGVITAEQIGDALGTSPVERPSRSGTAEATPPPRVPGSLETHYAPRARVRVVATADEVLSAVANALGSGDRVGVLGALGDTSLPEGVVDLRVPSDPAGYARHLYARLREADRRGVDVIVALPPEPEGVGLAVADRLVRAAGGAR
ncbi:MAG: L-threonylcarbamoyladenylate synthase [Acidimicrobiia bacterium]